MTPVCRTQKQDNSRKMNLICCNCLVKGIYPGFCDYIVIHSIQKNNLEYQISAPQKCQNEYFHMFLNIFNS